MPPAAMNGDSEEIMDGMPRLFMCIASSWVLSMMVLVAI